MKHCSIHAQMEWRIFMQVIDMHRIITTYGAWLHRRFDNIRGGHSEVAKKRPDQV